MTVLTPIQKIAIVVHIDCLRPLYGYFRELPNHSTASFILNFFRQICDLIDFVGISNNPDLSVDKIIIYIGNPPENNSFYM